MASNQPRRVLIVAARDLEPEVLQTCQSAAQESGFDYLQCETVSELDKLLQDVGWAYVLRVERSTADLKDEIRFVREFQAEITEGRLVPIALNFLPNTRASTVLWKMGFKEIISIGTFRPTVLKSRLSAFLRGTEQPDSRPPAPKESESRDSGSPIVVRKESFELVEPLQLPENCWLLRRPDDVRRVHAQWIVDLIGPGPSAGTWLRKDDSDVDPEDGHSVWEWIPKKETPEFFGKNGSWIFWGKRPQFQEFHWTFISKNPKLSFYQDQKPVCDFFCIGSGDKLRIPENSQTALDKWPAIHASVMNEYKVTVKSETIENPLIRFEKMKEKVIPWRDLMGLKETATGEPAPPRESKNEALAQIQRGVAPKSELFHRVADDVYRDGLLRELKNTQTTAQLWTPGQKIRFNAVLTDVLLDVPALKIQVPGDIDMEALLGRIFINIPYKRGSLFMAVEPRDLGFDGDHLVVKIPPNVYEVQRRTHFRLEIPQGSCLVRVRERYYPILNISGGGLALLADPEEADAFPSGAFLERIHFELSGMNIRCNAEVRWKTIRNSEGSTARLQIGVQFKSLHPKDQQRINLFVLEQGYHYLKEHLLKK